MNPAVLSNHIIVTATPLEKVIQDLETQWLELEEKSSCNVFLTWGWIGNWLSIVADKSKVYLLKAELEQETIGLGLLVEERVKRRRFIVSNTMVFNSIKHAPENMIIEHNGLLLKAGQEESVNRAVLCFLEANFPEIDEFIIPFSDQSSVIKTLCQNYSFSCRGVDATESPSVNLDFIRQNAESYIEGMSKNTRYQLRRSLRAYQSKGELGMEEAGDCHSALEFFSLLKVLHQHSWKQRGHGGSFSNQVWEQFHRNIIENQFDSQRVQLLRIFAGNHNIGVIYSLVDKGHVNMIQTGFDYDFVKNAKPGYVCHYLAIEHNIAKGMRVYDFLAGDSQYKRSLSNTMNYQEDLVLQRKKLKFLIENSLVSLYRKIR